MIVRELPDGSALLILQEAHADVAAQFAAHWGNQVFSPLDPSPSMVFGTIYHDSGHREMEADLPIDAERRLPYPFRGAPPGVRKREADDENVQWIRSRDPYASLIVSLHHLGLRKRRYDTVRMLFNGASSTSTDTEPLGVNGAFADLQGWQQEVAAQLELGDAQARGAFWHNYQCLQVFDLLSLYLCCDGYEGDRMREARLEQVPVAYDSGRVAELRLTPIGPTKLKITPYPFELAPLTIAVMARQTVPPEDQSMAREAYHRALRRPLVWQVTDGSA